MLTLLYIVDSTVRCISFLFTHSVKTQPSKSKSLYISNNAFSLNLKTLDKEFSLPNFQLLSTMQLNVEKRVCLVYCLHQMLRVFVKSFLTIT